jgi:hypothetical protein
MRTSTSARSQCHVVHGFLVAVVVLLSGCESYAPAPLDRQARLAEHLSDLEFAPGPGPLSIEAVSLGTVKQ